MFKPHGVLRAMVTPLDEGGRVNEPVLRRLARFLIEGGVHGLFPVGSTGEFYGLTLDEKRHILEVCLDEAAGRVPVYLGTGAITTREVVALDRMAEDTGAAAVSVLTPIFVSVSQEELYEHYRVIASETSLPVLLYNNAPRTGVTITAETVERLAKINNIVGIKDSTGDLTLMAEYIRRTRGLEFSVLAGRDTLIHACLVHGGVGAIAACANVAPRLVADIYDRFVAGDVAGSLEAQFRLAPLRLAFSLGTFPAVIKEALLLIGIDAGPCLAPVGRLNDEDRAQLQHVLEEIGVTIR